MTESELERLALLNEEAAEVQQIISKIIRHGYGSHNPFDENRTPNRELLNKELGDLLFAIQLMVENYDINDNSIQLYRMAKQNKIQKYLHFNVANPPQQ
ncbi:MAG TPA: hypothetical protein VGK39_07410 [Cyclobacteriaceae bacterium]